MNNILILGGTGFVGRSVCDKLVERSGGAGGQIVVPSRRPARAKHLQLLPTLRVVQADVHQAADLQRLVQGADAVINLVAVLHGSEAEFRRVHVDLPLKLADACNATGVRRVVHVSALGVSDAAPSRYLRSKAAGEAALKAAKLDLTILRPSVIFGEYDSFTNLFATLQALAPFVPLAGAQARFQPVWVQDVATAIVRCLDQPSTIGQTFECAGPEVVTLQQIVEQVGRWSGHERLVFGLPGAAARAQALLMELMPGTPLMSRDNIDSMRVPNVASGDQPGLAALGITAAPMASVVPGYLSAGRGLARLDGWRAKARRS
ncbi:MAG: complex I NDUFA9 subunit family protein [Burkholderiales bacterium]|nr:complex I NDUFA9 subunit family protein [Burkholderiales bacterium]